MYEALSLSMQACDYPAKDVQRVLMSAVDFSGSTDDSMKIARYLAKRGMKAEAISILRDVSRAAPLLTEPFELGLTLAKETQDFAAIHWACCGILKQSWPTDKATLFDEALLTAKANLMRLTKAGRVVEAQAYEKELKTALCRDVIVRVTWTGDADIDLSVQEPAGTICSFANPRTEAGGILLADVAGSAKSKTGEFSETYVCPQGFAGEYRILIRQASGNLAAGKVTLDVYTNLYSENQREIHEQIPVGAKDALVKVAIKDGHRDTPIAETQLAQAEAKRLTAGTIALGQLGSDSRSNWTEKEYQMLDQYAAARQDYFRNRLQFGNNGGVVGYQPQIQLLPSGATLIAPAGSLVISSDRRYVRFSGLPIFNQVTQVNTFNFISGQGGTTGGAQGGAGGGGIGFGGGGVGGGGGGVF
jgi:hypothetical protein